MMFLFNQLHPDMLGKKHSCEVIPLRRTVIFLITSKAKIPAYRNTEVACFMLCFGAGVWGSFNLFRKVLKSVAIKTFLQQHSIN